MDAQLVAQVNPLTDAAQLVYPSQNAECLPPGSIGDYVWFDLDQLPWNLAFDHADIIRAAIQQLS